MKSPDECCLRVSNRAQQRRDQVVDTARRLFASQGFHATGMAQIAKESGVAVGQIYRDFAAKEDIVAAIVEGDCGRFMAAETLRQGLDGGDAPAVRAWISHFVDPREKPGDPRLFAEIIAESTRNDRIAGVFASVQADMRCNLLSALALLAPDASADRRERVADIILTLSLGLAHHRLMRPDLRLDELTDALDVMIGREVAALGAPEPNRFSSTEKQ